MGCRHLLAHSLAGSGAFLLFGLAGGLHCLGMCGPLSCLLGRPEERPLGRLGLYHLGRLASYAALGAALASLGRPLRPALSWPVLACLGAVPLMAYAFWPREWAPEFLGRLHRAGARALAPLPQALRALGLGLLTPCLPCGLLYAAAGACVAAPDGGVGALWMVAFAAGTLPALALGQGAFAFAAAKRSPAWTLGLRRTAAAVAACTLLALSLLG